MTFGERQKSRETPSVNAPSAKLTDQDLQQWQDLSDRATPGPWQPCLAQPNAMCSCGLVWSIPVDSPVAAWHSADGHSGRPQDVLFIAAARTAIPALIAEVKELRKIVDPDAEHARLVLLKDATAAAVAEIGPKMDAHYGGVIEQLAGEKEQLRAEIERLRPIVEAAKAWRSVYRTHAVHAGLEALSAAIDAVCGEEARDDG